MQCRSLASQLGRFNQEFQAKGCTILLILGGSVEQARQYTEILKLPYPVLSDPDRRVYQLYGLEKVFFWQRTASLVIDRQGVIRYLHAAMNTLTWLQESRELLDFVRSMPGESPGNIKMESK